MIKYVDIGDQGRDGPPVALVKAASGRMGPNDRRAFVRRAGEEGLSLFNKCGARPGEEPIHLIALGMTEWYGCNRKGDGFRKETCVRDHPTFVKHARWYRDHVHDDPARSYGRVLASTFNRGTGRIELIVGLNATKAAAAANGGLVADLEMDRLASGLEIPVSMATGVPFDVCSGCGNRAKTRENYCDERSCVKYGGLKKNLGRTFEDGHTLHADNPVNRWFDISFVSAPADRTAYVFGRWDGGGFPQNEAVKAAGALCHARERVFRVFARTATTMDMGL